MAITTTSAGAASWAEAGAGAAKPGTNPRVAKQNQDRRGMTMRGTGKQELGLKGTAENRRDATNVITFTG